MVRVDDDTINIDDDGQLELHALDLLDDDEADAMEQRLRHDPAARQRVRELRGVASMLALEVEPLEPSPGLRRRILDAARADVDQEREREQPQQRHDPAPVVDLAERRAQRRSARAWVPWTAAAVLALMLSASLVWNARLQQDLDERIAAERHAVAASGLDGVSGAVLVIADDGTALLSLKGLQPPAPGRVYQVWLIADGAPQPNVTFLPDNHGFVNVAVLGDIDSFKLLAVTSEPAGGSDAPTTEPVLSSDLTVSS